MTFSEIFIKRSVTTILIVITLVLFGVYSYFQLPVSDLPTVDSPVVSVFASYPGANPQIMASRVATPLENQFMKISGLKNVISTNSAGSTRVTLNFNPGEDVDSLIPDIQAAIQKAKRSMPELPTDPSFSKRDSSGRAIMQYVFYSHTLGRKALYDLIDKRLVQPMRMLEGVADVTTQGMPFAIRIKLDPVKMAAYNTTLNEVTSAVHSSNLMSSGGGLRSSYDTISIIPEGQLTTPKEYQNLVIKYNNSLPVTLSNIGYAYNSTADEYFNAIIRVDGKDVPSNFVVVEISKKPDANTIKVATESLAMINKIKLELPKSVKGHMLIDSSENVKDSIDKVKETFVFAFILVLIIIFLFLGRITDTLIPAVVIPISIVSTFLIMHFLGFSIDNLSLLAITLAIGFIVDDSIVVLENTMRHIERGEDPYIASLVSSREIMGSVISMSASIIIVFVPIVFMPGMVGETFREFALTVIITVICSGILSLTLTPMMNAHLLNPISIAKKSRVIKIRDKILNFIVDKYSILLKHFLKRPYFSVILWFLCIFVTFCFYISIPKSFMPKGDSGVAYGAIVTPLGTSVKQMKKFQTYIYKILKADPNVEMFLMFSGTGGIDQSNGILVFKLKPAGERMGIEKVIGELDEKFSQIPYHLGGVYVSASPVLQINTGGGTGASGSQYAYVIKGTDSEVVNSCASELTAKLKENSEFQGIQSSVKLDMPMLKMQILRDKAAVLGISVSQIETALSNAFSLGKLTDYVEGTQVHDVYMQLEDSYIQSEGDLSHIHLRSSKFGSLVPLSDVVECIRTTGPQTITHYNQLNTATISFNLADGITLGKATETINDLSNKIFPPSVTGSFEGTAEQFVSTLKSLSILIIIAIFLLYVVLGILYESFIHPFTVLTTLPTATVGGLGFLLLFGSDLSLFAYVGMFLLIGLVVKNGIMMVDFAIQNMDNEKTSAKEAIHKACLIRFRPILMTGLTSLMGAIPIAIGVGSNASLRRPLGLVIVGGLLVSQFVTLFVTPGFFIYMQKLQDKYLNKFRLTRSYKLKEKDWK